MLVQMFQDLHFEHKGRWRKVKPPAQYARRGKRQILRIILANRYALQTPQEGGIDGRIIQSVTADVQCLTARYVWRIM